MKINQSLTVVVTALNEEKNILQCLELLKLFLSKHLLNYQIVFVDDGSTDETFAKVSSFGPDEKIKILKMEKNSGVGACIKAAIPHIETEWFCWFPSDLEFLPEVLLDALKFHESLDLIVTYPANSEKIRSRMRYYLSRTFTKIINVSFSLNLKYYNGITFYRKSAVSHLEINSNRFFFHAEFLIKSLKKKNCPYIEVPIIISARAGGKSNAIKLKVFADVMYCYLKNLWELKLDRRNNEHFTA